MNVVSTEPPATQDHQASGRVLPWLRDEHGLDMGGSLLQAVLKKLNDTSTPYCVLHGYADYPDRADSDVDCLMPREVLPHRLAAMIGPNNHYGDVAVVQWLQHEPTAHYLVLTAKRSDGSRSFLPVDVSSDYRRNGRVFYDGDEILATRRLHRGFWIPAPAVEFGYYLVKKVAKNSLREAHGQRLSELYRTDPRGCEHQITRFWNPTMSRLIVSAASSGDWGDVRRAIGQLRGNLFDRAALRDPGHTLAYWLTDLGRRARRWLAPTGLHVVILGADGSGKSTVIEAVRRDLAPAFRRTASWHFGPLILRRESQGLPVTEPHGRPGRSLPASLAKALYWFLDFTVGYQLKVRPALVRSTLVLFDRYLLDALVDPRRYRYGGPSWLLRAVWTIVPKPDLVILLDAPADVLQSRKQEVAFEETARQRDAYRSLVAELANGRVIDATQPLERVITDVNDAILDFLEARTARRLGLRGGRHN